MDDAFAEPKLEFHVTEVPQADKSLEAIGLLRLRGLEAGLGRSRRRNRSAEQCIFVVRRYQADKNKAHGGVGRGLGDARKF
jgi:hypothetical protein